MTSSIKKNKKNSCCQSYPSSSSKCTFSTNVKILHHLISATAFTRLSQNLTSGHLKAKVTIIECIQGFWWMHLWKHFENPRCHLSRVILFTGFTEHLISTSPKIFRCMPPHELLYSQSWVSKLPVIAQDFTVEG